MEQQSKNGKMNLFAVLCYHSVKDNDQTFDLWVKTEHRKPCIHFPTTL